MGTPVEELRAVLSRLPAGEGRLLARPAPAHGQAGGPLALGQRGGASGRAGGIPQGGLGAHLHGAGLLEARAEVRVRRAATTTSRATRASPQGSWWASTTSTSACPGRPRPPSIAPTTRRSSRAASQAGHPGAPDLRLGLGDLGPGRQDPDPHGGGGRDRHPRHVRAARRQGGAEALLREIPRRGPAPRPSAARGTGPGPRAGPAGPGAAGPRPGRRRSRRCGRSAGPGPPRCCSWPRRGRRSR